MPAVQKPGYRRRDTDGPSLVSGRGAQPWHSQPTFIACLLPTAYCRLPLGADAEGAGAATSQIEMRGLQLPRVVGISVALGDPIGLDDLRGRAASDQATQGGAPRRVPVPVIPEECK